MVLEGTGGIALQWGQYGEHILRVRSNVMAPGRLNGYGRFTCQCNGWFYVI